MAERWTHPTELRVMSLSMSDFDGTHPGSRRNLVICRNTSVLCSSSK